MRFTVGSGGRDDDHLGVGTARIEPEPPTRCFTFRLPEGVLDIPFRHERRRLLRFEAALLLDLQLRRLSRVSGAIDRALALRLRRLRSARGHVRLGFARFSDYARERLGVSVRTAQEWVRLGEGLDRLPVLDRALHDGRVTWTAAAQVARVAGSEDEAEWVGLAERLPVRELRERVERFLRSGDEGGSLGPGPPSEPVPDDETGRDTERKDIFIRAEDSPCPQPDPRSRKPGHDEPGISNHSAVSTCAADDDRVVRFSLEAPRGTALLWEAALDLCALVAGDDLPESDSTAYILAELLSALPAAEDEAPDGGTERLPIRRARGGAEFGGWRWFRHGHTPTSLPDAPAPELGPRDLPAAFSQETATALAQLDAPVPADPFDLDAAVRALQRARSSLDLDLARLLRLFHSFSLHQHVGFKTFAEYVGERLHISPSRARWLIRLDHRLLHFPSVAAAVRDGRLGSTAALLVCRVASSGSSASAWIEHARRRTVLRLRHEVTWTERQEQMRGWPGGSSLPPPPGRLPSVLETLTAELARTNREGADASAVAESGAPYAARCETFAHLTDLEELREALVAVAERPGAGARVRIGFWVRESAAEMWATARQRIAAATGRGHVSDSAVLLAAAVEFLVTYLPAWFEALEHGDPIAVRERFRCAIPGCSIHGGSAHHLRHRSQLGPDDPWNLLFLCYTHHIESAHRGRLRVHGRAPDDLVFVLGIREDGTALERFVNQDRELGPEPPPAVVFAVTDAVENRIVVAGWATDLG